MSWEAETVNQSRLAGLTLEVFRVFLQIVWSGLSIAQLSLETVSDVQNLDGLVQVSTCLKQWRNSQASGVGTIASCPRCPLLEADEPRAASCQTSFLKLLCHDGRH